MSSKSKKKSAGGVKDMAVDTWEKLEQVFESRVVRVLHAMQIPSHDDVQQLASRVEALTRVVEKLAGKPIVAAKPKTARKSTRKTSGKKAKTSSKKTAGKKKAAAKKRPASTRKKRAVSGVKKSRSKN